MLRLMALSLAIAVMLGMAPFVPSSWAVDLRTDAKTTLLLGGEVEAAGDFNGDGLADIVTADCELGKGEEAVGRTFVVLGPVEPGRFSSDDIGSKSIRIVGVARRDIACNPHPAGDVNGDGLDDLVIGAGQAETANGLLSGIAYVVFGKTDTETVQLKEFNEDQQGVAGFRIDGPGELALIGRFVDGAGDVNRDGLDDIVVGAPFFGSSYVVFGKPSPGPVDLADFEEGLQGLEGFRIDTRVPDYDSLYSVSGAGDVNGDGLADIVVGTIASELGHGDVHVVFGKPDPPPVDVRRDGPWGFTARGPARSYAGKSVAEAGDLNDDGLGDIVVGAAGDREEGRAFAIYGRTDTKAINLADKDWGGFKMVLRTQPGNHLGDVVASTPDIDGDGKSDLILGSFYISAKGREGSGAVYVVTAKPTNGVINLASLGGRGFRIIGARGGDQTANAAGPGDVTGDGCPDLLLGALGRRRRTYVVWRCSRTRSSAQGSGHQAQVDLRHREYARRRSCSESESGTDPLASLLPSSTQRGRHPGRRLLRPIVW